MPAHNVDEAGLDLALEDAFEPGQEVMVTEPAPVGTVVAEVETEVPGQDDWELPGLVSSDGSKGTKGQAGLRKRLQDRARGKRNGAGNSVAKRVEVGPRSARPVGPAVKEGTEARQVQRRVRGAADAGQTTALRLEAPARAVEVLARAGCRICSRRTSAARSPCRCARRTTG